MSTLPGQIRKLSDDENLQCDDCDNMATHRVVGECDSSGTEYHYMCAHHFEDYRGFYANLVSYDPTDL